MRHRPYERLKNRKSLQVALSEAKQEEVFEHEEDASDLEEEINEWYEYMLLRELDSHDSDGDFFIDDDCIDWFPNLTEDFIEENGNGN